MNSNRMIAQLIMPVRKDPESHRKALEAVAYYDALGFDVFNPHDMPKIINGLSVVNEAKVQAGCLYHLAFADLAVILPGWESSEGCINEITFATAHGIPLYFYKSNIRVFFNTNTQVEIESQAPGDIITPEVMYGRKEVRS